jgi:acid phosphatase (class A)
MRSSDNLRHVFFSLILIAAVRAIAGQAPAPTPSRSGYLAQEQVPDVIHIVPPAPLVGDARYTADLAIFRATRSLEGSDRWVLALSDDNVSTQGLMNAFSCALGVTPTAENAPRLRGLITRANADTLRAAVALKRQYQHKRPFQVAEGKVCLSDRGRAALETDPDYPSGHTAASWEIGLLFAELAPDAASAVLTRARAFGESRIVCGVHNASAVEAGRLTATAVFAAQHGSPDFRADAEAARAELALLRARAAERPASCAVEAATLASRPY